MKNKLFLTTESSQAILQTMHDVKKDEQLMERFKNDHSKKNTSNKSIAQSNKNILDFDVRKTKTEFDTNLRLDTNYFSSG